VGQWVVGTALGLYFSPDAAARIASLWPFLAAATVYAGFMGAGFTWALMRFGRADPATAFFGGSIGGATEMSLQGARAGGAMPLMVAGHSLRVLIVVAVIPFGYQFLGIQGSDATLQTARDFNPYGLLPLLASSAVAGWTAARFSLPNAWVLGPLFGIAITGVAGVDWSGLPTALINLGQLLIGMSLGSRFLPGFFRSAPRYLAVIAVGTLIAIPLTIGFAWLLAAASGVAFATLVLATAPGGVAEMSLTAKALRLGVPVVAVFHLVRYIILVVSMGPLYCFCARHFGWPTMRGRID
jgi:membrane AbrB-like protein